MHHLATAEHRQIDNAPFTMKRHMHGPASPSHIEQILASPDAWDKERGTSCYCNGVAAEVKSESIDQTVRQESWMFMLRLDINFPRL